MEENTLTLHHLCRHGKNSSSALSPGFCTTCCPACLQSSKRRPLSGYWSFACSAVACFRIRMSGRLLGQTDFAHQFGVTRIGAQGIEREVGPEGDQPGVVLLVCRIKPLEGMILVAQIGI
jgi:hypothetical protein